MDGEDVYYMLNSWVENKMQHMLLWFCLLLLGNTFFWKNKRLYIIYMVNYKNSVIFSFGDGNLTWIGGCAIEKKGDDAIYKAIAQKISNMRQAYLRYTKKSKESQDSHYRPYFCIFRNNVKSKEPLIIRLVERFPCDSKASLNSRVEFLRSKHQNLKNFFSEISDKDKNQDIFVKKTNYHVEKIRNKKSGLVYKTRMKIKIDENSTEKNNASNINE